MKLQIMSISRSKLYLHILYTILDFQNIIKYETRKLAMEVFHKKGEKTIEKN